MPVTDTSVDLYARIEGGDSWRCPRCGRRTRQYPAMSHARDERTGVCPDICSDCGDDEDWQKLIDGTLPTEVRHWPVRRQLGSLRQVQSRRIVLPSSEDEEIRESGPRIGLHWDGKLKEWLAAILTVDPDSKDQPRDLQTWSFPTRRLLDEYLASVIDHPEHEVRALLRHFLFDATTFGFDDNLLRTVLPTEQFEVLREKYEYFRRLPRTPFSGMQAHPGVRWVIDLLPEAPGRAAVVVESYVRAHKRRLPAGRQEGLADAFAVINAYYIDHSAVPWREALMGISPRQFEHLIARLYVEMGFDVKLTPPQRDGGRDVEALKTVPGGKQKLLVECKFYRDAVGVKEARALLGVVSDERASGGVLLTTGRCTKGVRTLAETNDRLDFVDGEKLALILNEYFGPHWPQRLGWLTRPL